MARRGGGRLPTPFPRHARRPTGQGEPAWHEESGKGLLVPEAEAKDKDLPWDLNYQSIFAQVEAFIQRSLPPLRNPLQVRFADSGGQAGDRGQSNAENKLFVGGVPAGCGDKELRSLFAWKQQDEDYTEGSAAR